MLKRSLLVMGLLIAGCSKQGPMAQEPRGTCGESFCLPASAKLIDKERPVEDFNLYDVEWRGTQYRIYEGNNPRFEDEMRGKPLRLPIDQAAILTVAKGIGRVLITLKSDCKMGESCWPMYLDVAGSCPLVGHCQVEDFAAQLSRR
jgi:hypothetical protein